MAFDLPEVTATVDEMQAGCFFGLCFRSQLVFQKNININQPCHIFGLFKRTTFLAYEILGRAKPQRRECVRRVVFIRQAVMELPATKRAYELTLSSTLDIPNEERATSSAELCSTCRTGRS